MSRNIIPTYILIIPITLSHLPYLIPVLIQPCDTQLQNIVDSTSLQVSASSAIIVACTLHFFGRLRDKTKGIFECFGCRPVDSCLGEVVPCPLGLRQVYRFSKAQDYRTRYSTEISFIKYLERWWQ